MRRKLMAGALALAMVGSLVACGGGEKKAASEGEKQRGCYNSTRVVKAKAEKRSIISSDTHVWTEQTRSSLQFRINQGIGRGKR